MQRRSKFIFITGGVVSSLGKGLSAASIGALLIEFADRTVRGFNVVRIEPRADGTRLHVREDPGFDIDGEHINLTSSPQRTIQGAALRYDLPALAK